MSSKRTGKCLCGAVHYTVTPSKANHVHVCHCNICQTWHGGPGLAMQVKPDWDIKGEENLSWYRSSGWAQRAFCSICGTSLFFKTDSGDYYGVATGSFDQKGGLEIDTHIFVDKKPEYYDFADKAPRLTEEEFLKMIGAME